MDTLGEGVGRIIGQHWTGSLTQDLAVVVLLIDKVDGDTTFLLSGCYHGFVYMMAVHALTTIFGQESGMDIDDPIGESL